MAADTLAAPVTGRQLRLGPRTRWETAALLAATAALYLWNLDINGWANPFYSAAAQAGADNFTAFFFGSSDPANSISVDKPPLALWFMSLSVKLFGLSPWSILVPQALMGVATVWFVYRITADYCGHRWGLLAGTMMAVTPTAAMIFRFNNPDALLTLIMTASAYVTIRAMRARQVRWLALTGALVGAGFLTKQLQVAFIVPAIAVTIVAFGPWPLLTRLRAAGLTAGTALAVAGTWLGAVALTPAAARPFIGGTRSNSFLELTLGYNGLDRLTGAGSARAAMPGTDGGEPNIPGVLRYLVPEWSSQITWFLPLACAGLIVLVPALRHAHNRSRAEPAFVVLMGLWFLTSAGALSLVSVQTIHPYYFLALAPATSCLAAAGLKVLLARRNRTSTRVLIAGAVGVSAIVAQLDAHAAQSTFPWLPPILGVAWAIELAWLILPRRPEVPTERLARAGLVLTLLFTPALWSAYTVAVPHAGAGPTGGPPINGTRPDDPADRTLNGLISAAKSSTLFGALPDTIIVDRLREARPTATWAAAAIGSSTAGLYQLESQRAVIPIGGFDGTDAAPTLEAFESFVKAGKVAYFIDGVAPPTTEQGLGESAGIRSWVRNTFTCERIGSTCLYDLSAASR